MKLYRPSNGTEGMEFEVRFCRRCIFSDNCPILVAACWLDIDDGDYPAQWQYDENNAPVCTAFTMRWA